jgi:hypothetical protein
MTLVAEKYGNTSSVGSEVLISRFNKLAKDHFQISIRNDSDQINIIKESIRFFSLDLPNEIKEIFISSNDAPLFWIFESSLLTQIEEFMKFNFKGIAHAELHKQIKENYTRWATTKLKSEKEYYSTTTINLIERDINKHNFFKLILNGILHTYQSTYYNSAKALELFEGTLELINTLRLNDQLKIDLKYIVYLYTGFLHLKQGDFEKANLTFKEALEERPNGCTAKLYCALAEINLGNEDLALYYLKEVFTYDIQRLGIALKMNNAAMFNYLFRNAFIYNIFQERDFAKGVEATNAIFNEYRNHDEKILEKCLENLSLVKNQRLDEYYDDEIKKTIYFLEKIIPVYLKTSNTLLYAAYPEFKDKVNGIIAGIINKVRELFYSEVKQSLQSYDLVIKDNLSAEKHLRDELESFKTKMKEHLAKALQKISDDYETEAKTIEKRITELPNIDRYNPRVSLSNNMTYNIIIAFIVFFIGGVTGYSNRLVDDVTEFNSMFTLILMSGSKWGAVSFLIGVVISLIMSGIILMERYEIKSKLQKRLNFLKVEKDKAVTDIKDSTAEKEKMMIENMNSSISHHKKRAEELKEQRAVAEKDLIAKADQKTNEVTAVIAELVI